MKPWGRDASQPVASRLSDILWWDTSTMFSLSLSTDPKHLSHTRQYPALSKIAFRLESKTHGTVGETVIN